MSKSQPLTLSNNRVIASKSNIPIVEYQNPKSLNELCETICKTYHLSDVEELQSLVQNELSMTITQFIDSKLTSQSNEINVDDQTNDFDPNSSFVISAPINDLWELSTIVNKSNKRVVDLYVKIRSSAFDIPNQHMDDDGNTFTDVVSIPNQDKVIKIGTATRDKSNQWMIRVDSALPTRYIDINMYSRCWLCHNNKAIRDFLNDIFLRINKIGKYSPVGSTSLVKESIDDPEDMTTYEIEYDPDEIIVYIKDNIDPDLNEDNEEDTKQMIVDFLESLPGVDHCELIGEGFTPVKAFLVGYAVPKSINLLKRIIPSTKSTYVDHSKNLVAMNNANRQAALASRR